MGLLQFREQELSKPLPCVRGILGYFHNIRYTDPKVCTLRAGELIYSDTCEPFSVPDINDEFYVQAYIDDYSRLKVTCFMKQKTKP